MQEFLSALLLGSGYNAALVAVGAALLGMAAGGAGTFVFLRKRALVSDAAAHATLPGIGLAFLAMVALGGDGRNIFGLLAGSALSAAVGLLAVEWIVKSTRLSEDTAIGSVLSVFFGFGIVLLTVIQSMSSGKQAGLEGYLLGSTAGMLFQEAVTIAVAGAGAAVALLLLHRRMTIVAFDPEYAETSGYNVRQTDLMSVGLVLLVTVIGLKVVGLVLIVALLIIPSVTARFWTERVDRLALIAALVGGLSAYIGAALSAAFPKVPTGSIIVLVSFVAFVLSFLFAPARGLAMSIWRHWNFQKRVHRRQGLLAMARGEPIYDAMTLRVLRGLGYLRADGVPTLAGRAAAAQEMRNEALWELARETNLDLVDNSRFDGLSPIETVLTADEIADLNRRFNQKIGAVS